MARCAQLLILKPSLWTTTHVTFMLRRIPSVAGAFAAFPTARVRSASASLQTLIKKATNHTLK